MYNAYFFKDFLILPNRRSEIQALVSYYSSLVDLGVLLKVMFCTVKLSGKKEVRLNLIYFYSGFASVQFYLSQWGYS